MQHKKKAELVGTVTMPVLNYPHPMTPFYQLVQFLGLDYQVPGRRLGNEVQKWIVPDDRVSIERRVEWKRQQTGG